MSSDPDDRSDSQIEPLEVLTFGRSGVDIYPLQIGVGLEDVQTFGKYLGGTTANVAVAAARLGRRAAIITGVGDDPFGRFVRRALRELDVDDQYVVTNTRVRHPGDLLRDLPAGRLPALVLPQADGARPAGQAVRHRLRRRPRHPADVAVGHRPQRGAQPRVALRRAGGAGAQAVHRARSGLPADVLGDPSARHRAGAARRCRRSRSPSATARSARSPSARPSRRRRPTRCSPPGSSWRSSSRGPRACWPRPERERVESPPIPIRPLNGLGAGDSFGGSLCHGLLAGWPLEKVLQRANAAGAIVASRLECSTAMPTEAEIETLIAGGDPNARLADSLAVHFATASSR